MMLLDVLALLVFAVCLIGILHPEVPSGVVGSVGLGMMGSSALVAIDDASMADAGKLEMAVLAMLLGILLMAAHYALLIWRAHRAAGPRRRITDWADLDDGNSRRGEEAWQQRTNR